MSYWDSSALVKLYLDESDSRSFKEFALISASLWTSQLALYEIRVVLWRKQAEGAIVSGAAAKSYDRLLHDVAGGFIRVIGFTRRVEAELDHVIDRCFGHKPPIMLRTLDALHLASALAVSESAFVSTDKRLREAAVQLGSQVIPPTV